MFCKWIVANVSHVWVNYTARHSGQQYRLDKFPQSVKTTSIRTNLANSCDHVAEEGRWVREDGKKEQILFIPCNRGGEQQSSPRKLVQITDCPRPSNQSNSILITQEYQEWWGHSRGSAATECKALAGRKIDWSDFTLGEGDQLGILGIKWISFGNRWKKLQIIYVIIWGIYWTKQSQVIKKKKKSNYLTFCISLSMDIGPMQCYSCTVFSFGKLKESQKCQCFQAHHSEERLVPSLCPTHLCPPFKIHSQTKESSSS